MTVVGFTNISDLLFSMFNFHVIQKAQNYSLPVAIRSVKKWRLIFMQCRRDIATG